ncbi:MAG TPA: ABC transporter substrate-binding protein [Chitinophagales bacterium]|nr:ABC transporter substrate-binding protein [Chitinophagales bacterium]
MKWYIFIIALFLTACSTSKKSGSSTTPIYVPKTEKDAKDQDSDVLTEKELEQERLDSIQEAQEEIPTKDDKSAKSSYNIAVVLPFMIDKVPLDYTPYEIKTDMNLSSEIMQNLDFYMGLKLAVDDFKNKSKNYNVFILDDANSDFQNKKIINERPFPDIDIIISGTEGRVSKEILNFSESNKIPFYSPFATDINQSSPYYHTIIPNITNQVAQLFNYIYPQIPEADVYIIQEENTDSARAIMRTAEAYIKKTYNVSPIIITNTQNTVNELGETISFFNPSSTSIVFVPSNNAIFVKGLLPKLYTAAHPTYILGMPSWNNLRGLENSTQPHPDIFIPVFDIAKKSKADVESFSTRFINEFQKEENENVYLGYDLMNYILTGLEKNTIWNNPTSSDLNIKPYYFGFDFSPVMKNNRVQFYSNNKVSIYKYEKGRFANITP